ncbi:MAG: hypothetical protein MUF30_13275 [Burkholderiales bacterium]|jgi:hypothetical protein|nr:hypothetical protein [Burkholderiales bacterium]
MDPILSVVHDPVAVGAVVGALALIVLAAAWHKFTDADAFLAALAAYRLLPARWVAPAAKALPAIELALALGVLVPPTRGAALVALAALFAVYGAAIGINLARGRSHIDCGCGGDAHSLTWGLVGRNAVLALLALIAAGGIVDREFEWLDAVTLVVGVLALYALYLMADEVLKQFGRIAQLKARQS